MKRSPITDSVRLSIRMTRHSITACEYGVTEILNELPNSRNLRSDLRAAKDYLKQANIALARFLDDTE